MNILAIEPSALADLRVRDDAGNDPRFFHDDEGGAPLRCCLRSSRPGEDLLLLAYAPLRRWAERTGADPGPYDEMGPIFIHAGPCEGFTGGVPVVLTSARRVLRRYSAKGEILGGELTAEPDLAAQFADPRVALVHVRAVEYGCFLFSVEAQPLES